jgi:DNA-binding XRE family transcriptional regulator
MTPKDLNAYTEAVTVDLDALIAEMMQDASHRQSINAEKTKLVIASAVLEAREAAGLSQQTLADQAGLPQTTIARIERGNNTSIETLAKIATALGKTVFVALI